jgi:hypothetical protein
MLCNSLNSLPLTTVTSKTLVARDVKAVEISAARHATDTPQWVTRRDRRHIPTQPTLRIGMFALPDELNPLHRERRTSLVRRSHEFWGRQRNRDSRL